MLMVVLGFVFGGWDVTNFGAQALVVEPLDVGQGGQLDVIGVTPRALAFDRSVL